MQEGVGRDVLRRWDHPALRVVRGDDREVGRPVRGERLTAEDGLPEKGTERGIHGRERRTGGARRVYFCAMSCSSWIAQGWFLVTSVSVTFTNLVSLPPKYASDSA